MSEKSESVKLEEQRLEWFKELCRKAYNELKFAGLAEMLEWMAEHSGQV